MVDQKLEDTKVASQVPHDSLPMAIAPRPCHNNKFAYACGMLASMNTIILGYGKPRGLPLFFFFFRRKEIKNQKVS